MLHVATTLTTISSFSFSVSAFSFPLSVSSCPAIANSASRISCTSDNKCSSTFMLDNFTQDRSFLGCIKCLYLCVIFPPIE